jgi:Holliday junction resolvasome RuvABC DNA-binding subunit
MEQHDHVLIIRAKLNAENAAKTTVEQLVSLGVSEREIENAIEHLRHEARTKAISELSKRKRKN